MEKLVKVRGGGQITLPKDIREELGISEGTTFRVTIVSGGIQLEALELLTREEIYLLSEEFQAIARRVDEAEARGELIEISSGQELLDMIRSKAGRGGEDAEDET